MKQRDSSVAAGSSKHRPNVHRPEIAVSHLIMRALSPSRILYRKVPILDNLHTRDFHMRMTEKEYQTLHENAKRTGLPLSTYMRLMIKGMRPKELRTVDWFKFNQEECKMSQMLGNLVDIAKRDHYIDAAKLEEFYEAMLKANMALFAEVFESEQMDISSVIRTAKAQAEFEQRRQAAKMPDFLS